MLQLCQQNKKGQKMTTVENNIGTGIQGVGKDDFVETFHWLHGKMDEYVSTEGIFDFNEYNKCAVDRRLHNGDFMDVTEEEKMMFTLDKWIEELDQITDTTIWSENKTNDFLTSMDLPTEEEYEEGVLTQDEENTFSNILSISHSEKVGVEILLSIVQDFRETKTLNYEKFNDIRKQYYFLDTYSYFER